MTVPYNGILEPVRKGGLQLLPIIRLSEPDIDVQVPDEDCVICLQALTDKQVFHTAPFCNHFFHKEWYFNLI